MTLNRKRVDAQTTIRRAMLANGYTPLANAEKMCLLQGWPTLEVDEAVIDSWSDSLRYQSTGLRIDGDLCAIDIDIDDKRIVYALFDWAADTFGEKWEKDVLIRVREGSHKETWLMRVDEPFGVPTGPKYGRPGEETDHCVELYGSGQRRQIGVYGWHTANEIEYRWAEDRGPAEVPLAELPVVPKAKVFEVYAKSKELMEAANWERRDTKFVAADHGSVVYDLPDDLEVVTSYGVMPVALAAGDRCRMLEITGEGSNTNRGLVSMTDHGPAVWDSESYTTHMLASARPQGTLEKAKTLGDRLKAIGLRVPSVVPPTVPVKAEEAEESWEKMTALVGELVQRYALFANGGENERWVCMFTGRSYSHKALRMLLAPMEMTLEAETPSGRPTTKVVNPCDLMPKRADRTEIVGFRFTPGNDARLIEGDDGLYLNLWSPPWFGDAEPVEDVTWFLEFLEYLVPDENECAYLLNWLAHKVKHQGERGVAMLLVTPTFGTGRNVLMKITGLLLGQKFCGDVAQAVLTGASSQSQYDDALINKVLITCDEIVAGHNSYDLRVKAFERLKSVCDPYAQLRGFNRKGLSMVHDYARYSALLASNHPYDALPLPPADRRFAVLECTRAPFGTHRPDIKEIVDRVLPLGKPPSMSHILGLYNWLLTLDTDASAFHTVPDTLVRREMIEDGEGEVEKTIRTFLEKLPPEQPCFRFDDLARRGKQWLAAEHPAVARAFERLSKKKMREGFAGWTMGRDRVRVGHDGRGAARERGIVERDGTTLTPADRARWLTTEEE